MACVVVEVATVTCPALVTSLPVTDGGGDRHGLIVQAPIVEVAHETGPGRRNSASRVNDGPLAFPAAGTLLLIQNAADPSGLELVLSSVLPPQAAARGRSNRYTKRFMGRPVAERCGGSKGVARYELHVIVQFAPLGSQNV